MTFSLLHIMNMSYEEACERLSTHTYQYIELCTHAARAPDETTIALTRDTSTTSHTCTDCGCSDNVGGF